MKTSRVLLAAMLTFQAYWSVELAAEDKQTGGAQSGASVSMGQNGMGGPMGLPVQDPMMDPGSMPGGFPAVRGSLPAPAFINALECSFKTQVDQSDQALLQASLSAIQALEGSDQCAPPQGQVRPSTLLTQALSNYQNATGADLPAGYVGNISTTCFNYERLFNEEYDYFLANWERGRSTHLTNYSSCVARPDRTAAVTCAANVLSRQKSQWEFTCRQSANAVVSARAAQIQSEALRQSIDALRSMIHNPNCVDATGAARASLIQSGFQLASRAAMVELNPASPLTLLASGALDLLGDLLGDMFRERSYSESIISQSQFNDLACMYEEVELRAFRCDKNRLESQLEANIGVERQVCEDVNQNALRGYLSGLDGFIPQFAQASLQIASPAPTPAAQLTSEQVGAMAHELTRLLPSGSGEPVSMASLLNQAADLVTNGIQRNMNRSQLEDYIREHNISVQPTDYRQLREQLNRALDDASALKNFINVVQASGAIVNDELEDLSPEQLAAVQRAMPPRGLNAIQQVLALAQRHSPSESDQVAFFNARLDQGRTLGSVLSAQNDRRRQLAALPTDNAVFEAHRRGLQHMMRARFEGELERLVNRAQVAQRNFDPANTTQVRKQQIVAESLYPIARMCNQLRSHAISLEEYPWPDNLPRACQNFVCDNNVGTFARYLQRAGNQAGASLDSRGRCQSADCNGYYSQFVCHERLRIDEIRNNVFSEFERSGTVCGRRFTDLRF